jgi:hypothetical protein
MAVLNASLPPSGVVPGGNAGGHGEHAFIHDGEGFDGILQVLFRVLLAKVQIIFYSEVLFVTFEPTAPT